MTIARCEDNEFKEFREADISAIPPHKLYSSETGCGWLPCVFDTQPPDTYETGRSCEIVGSEARVTRTWAGFPPAPAPDQITNAQLRQWLAANGLFDAVNQAVTAQGGATQIKWEYANVVLRSDPLVSALAAGLGKTDADLDAMFIEAIDL